MIKLPAFAKINLYLRVLGKREEDGFHEICTVFQTISLHDTIDFELAEEISLTCDHPHVPTDGSNLIYQAALGLKEKFNINLGAKIHLEKRIPSPGGLGGGSADAAVALLGLKKLWKIDAQLADLIEISSTLGSDVPFFLTGGTALGIGRGTEIESLPDGPEMLLLIVTPNEKVPTAEAYHSLNAPFLTKEKRESILTICCSEAVADSRHSAKFRNDFEPVIFQLKPEIRRVKDRLLTVGAANALMSGSGASVFGIFDNELIRQKALESLQNETDWQIFSTETVSGDKYKQALNLVR